MRVNPRQRNVKAVYKTYIDVIHYKKTDKKKLYANDPDRSVTTIVRETETVLLSCVVLILIFNNTPK